VGNYGGARLRNYGGVHNYLVLDYPDGVVHVEGRHGAVGIGVAVFGVSHQSKENRRWDRDWFAAQGMPGSKEIAAVGSQRPHPATLGGPAVVLDFSFKIWSPIRKWIWKDGDQEGQS
jgi:hypothetical protein